MTDLISKNQNELVPEEVFFLNSLVNKYVDVLNELTTHEKKLAPFLAYALEISVNYIKEKYNDLDKDWKTWCTVYIKRYYYKKGIENDAKILELIDSFVNHYNSEYQKYQETMGFSGSNYEKENTFVINYMNR